MSDYENKTKEELIKILMYKNKKIKAYNGYCKRYLGQLCVLFELIQELSENDEEGGSSDKINAVSVSGMYFIDKIMETELY